MARSDGVPTERQKTAADRLVDCLLGREWGLPSSGAFPAHVQATLTLSISIEMVAVIGTGEAFERGRISRQSARLVQPAEPSRRT